MFRSHRSFEQLIEANPVSLTQARVIAVGSGLDELVRSRIVWGSPPRASGSSTRVSGTSESRVTLWRRRMAPVLVGSAALVCGLAVAIAPSPAFAFLKQSVLPFFGLANAPASVQIEFGSLPVGAPAGMDPHAVASETRKVMIASFGGESHTLWVAPTRSGGFCFMWSPGYGGCNADGTVKLDGMGPVETPGGVADPILTIGEPATDRARAIEQGHHLATVTPWLLGYVTGSDTQAVRLAFSDGSSATLPVTWVSAPVSAGFYTYEVPANEQSASHHLVSVETVDANGDLVARQQIAGGG